MALVHYGSIITELSGHIGGHVFQKSAAGFIVHTLARPSRWLSLKRQAQRNNFLRVVNLWNSLSPSDVIAWNAASSDYPQTDPFGNPSYLTGYALFLMLNLNLIQASFAPITVPMPPEAPIIISGLSASLSISAGNFFWDWLPNPVPINVNFIIYAGNQATGLSQRDPHNNYKFLAVIGATTGSHQDFATQYGILYPNYLTFKPGHYIYCLITAIHQFTGQRDIIYNFSASIIA